MIRAFLKIALRNFIKERFFSAINLLGLSVGISVTLLIAVYILHELSYDRFHNNASRIYRIAMHLEMGGNIGDLNSTFPPLAAAMESDLPEVEYAVRLWMQHGRFFKLGERIFAEDNVLHADPDFFEVFNFNVLAGNRKTALLERNQVMLTPALVEKYFQTQDLKSVVGESIYINQELYTVTGVVAPAPENSHFHFTAIVSMDSHPVGRDKGWNNMNVSTYVLLHNNASITSLLEKMPGLLGKYMENYEEHSSRGILIRPFAQALTDIHLKSNIQGEFEPTTSLTTLYVFGAVACIVLLLACVNFVNLTTARSANRAKEVGVRKVLGSASSQLMRQFTLESVMMVLIATLLALGAVELMRYPFNDITGKQLSMESLLTPSYATGLVAFVILLGILAGSYPAFFLAGYRPAEVLKGKIRSGFKSSKMRNSLVLLQFTISIALITCTLIVQHQLDFMRARKLGFDKENVIIIDNANQLPSQQAFINKLKELPTVQLAGASSFRPIDDYDGMGLLTEKDKENMKLVNFSVVDFDYLEALKFEFIQGRNFSRDFPSDSLAVIINETAADFLYGEECLGKKLSQDDGPSYTIVGIVKDFNFESLKNEVKPLVFFLQENQRFVNVRLNPGDFSAAIRSIESQWKEQQADVPFSYTFLDESYNNLFRAESRLGLIFGIFTVLGLFIACLGLLGLAAYMAEQRSKEISVRKVLGATAYQIVFLLGKDFARLIIIAMIVAVPIAYYLMQEWLAQFAYRTEVSTGVLIFGGILVLIIAFLTVSYQSIRAALANPVNALKEE